MKILRGGKYCGRKSGPIQNSLLITMFMGQYEWFYHPPKLTQFSLNNVHKRGIKHHNLIYHPPLIFPTVPNIYMYNASISCFVTFSRAFSSNSNILIPIITYLITIIFSTIYHYSDFTSKISHIGQSRWEDK